MTPQEFDRSAELGRMILELHRELKAIIDAALQRRSSG
jgi:hypothetical protein